VRYIQNTVILCHRQHRCYSDKTQQNTATVCRVFVVGGYDEFWCLPKDIRPMKVGADEFCSHFAFACPPTVTDQARFCGHDARKVPGLNFICTYRRTYGVLDLSLEGKFRIIASFRLIRNKEHKCDPPQIRRAF